MKEFFKCGQIWRSKEYPHVDFIVDSVYYDRFARNAYDFNLFSYVIWQIANKKAFDKKVCEAKGVSSIDEILDNHCGNTFPYASFGETKPNSLKQRIKKYNMYLDEIRNYQSIYKVDNKFEYSESIEDGSGNKFFIDYECRDEVYGLYKE